MAQNMVAEHYERYFDIIFNFKAKQNLVVELIYERDFDMIFISMAAHILVAELYETDFDMIFIPMAAQILVAELYERDFDMIFPFKGNSKLRSRAL